MKQQTIKTDFTLSGKGLHTGIVITAHFCPAPENHGIRICRVDLPGQPTHSALASYVTQTSRGTVLENGKWKVSTVEHVLSALYALNITNCLIEVNAPEVPILDGSAKPIVDAVLQAGIVTQEAEADEWVVTEPLYFDNGKGCKMTITPCDRYEVVVDVDYPSPILHLQRAELTDLSTFPKEVAEARTFCFLREIKWLLRLGLIKGGDLNNALVIYDKKMSQRSLDSMTDKLNQPHIDASKLGYLSPLKYENEPARHKLLDVIGDLSLLGMRIQGRVKCYKPGHTFNTQCVRRLRNQIVSE